jgi:hypothetical protein
MIETINSGGETLCIIIRSGFSTEGIKFITPGQFPQQLGYMKRDQGYKIAPHTHKKVERKVTLSQEVLFVKAGKVKVSIFDNLNVFVQDTVISAGDVILLASGGHAFEMLETSEIIEVKQGPYLEDDKVFIDPIY